MKIKKKPVLTISCDVKEAAVMTVFMKGSRSRMHVWVNVLKKNDTQRLFKEQLIEHSSTEMRVIISMLFLSSYLSSNVDWWCAEIWKFEKLFR